MQARNIVSTTPILDLRGVSYNLLEVSGRFTGGIKTAQGNTVSTPNGTCGIVVRTGPRPVDAKRMERRKRREMLESL